MRGPVPSASPRPTWRAVAVPAEHGGWSLTLEPVLLGLLVAPSGAGVALGAAAFVAFVARTPLKVVLVDRWRDRWLPRTAMAARVLAAESLVLVVLVGVAAASADRRFWVALALAAPLVAVELWFDMRSRSRRLVPELAGAAGIGSVAAAIALAGGLVDRVAVGLWLVLAARSSVAIPYVRIQLERARRADAAVRRSDAAQVAGVGAVVAGWAQDAVPLAAVMALVAVAAYHLVAVRTAPRPAVRIGVEQTVVGLSVVLVTALAVLMP